MEIKINTKSLSAVELATLYVTLMKLGQINLADQFYRAGIQNCGAQDFGAAVSQARKLA